MSSLSWRDIMNVVMCSLRRALQNIHHCPKKTAVILNFFRIDKDSHEASIIIVHQIVHYLIYAGPNPRLICWGPISLPTNSPAECCHSSEAHRNSTLASHFSNSIVTAAPSSSISKSFLDICLLILHLSPPPWVLTSSRPRPHDRILS